MALFEIGPVFHGGEPEDQEILATGILVGHTNARDVHGERREFDPFDIKADVEKVLKSIGCPTKLMILRNDLINFFATHAELILCAKQMKVSLKLICHTHAKERLTCQE